MNKTEIENVLWNLQNDLLESHAEYCTAWQWIEQGRLPKQNAKWIYGNSYIPFDQEMLRSFYNGPIPFEELQNFTDANKNIFDVVWSARIGGSDKYMYCSINDTYKATCEELAAVERLYNKRGELDLYDGCVWWTEETLKKEIE